MARTPQRMLAGKTTRLGARRQFDLGRIVFCLTVLLIAFPTVAHVGSPDVFYEGNAGPYHLFIVVRVPQVIPGVAEVEIRSASDDITEVRIVDLRLSGAGAERAPAPDLTQRSSQDPHSFAGSLWLMESGALQVRIEVAGARGKGELAVPVAATAQQKLPMTKPLAAGLFSLLVVLALGAVAITVAAAREATLSPGEVPSTNDRRRARRVLLVASLMLLALLYLGKKWWDAEDAVAAASVYRTPRVSATFQAPNRLLLGAQVGQEQSGGLLHGWQNPGDLDDLIPDHGHLMHVFLVRVPAMDSFIHLHPEKADSGLFLAELPTMAAGRYRIFADIVHQSGFPATLVGEIELPAISAESASGDDCQWSGSSIIAGDKDTTISQLPDGGRMVWQRPPTSLKMGVPASFRFRVEDQGGNPAQDLEPYMGMAGHAEFVRSDLTTFAHVHPAGSVPMAVVEMAQADLLAGLAERSGSVEAGVAMPMAPLAPEISFPYGFPRSGNYRIFVQIKRAGRIETGVFDAHVD